MTSIFCPCIDCTNNNKRNRCKAKKINLSHRVISTRNGDRMAMWVCDKYDLSEEAKEMFDAINAALKVDGDSISMLD